MSIKRWEIRQTDEALCTNLQAQTGLPEIVTRVLAARGYDTAEKASAFLAGENTLTDPMALKDMDKAVERIQRAIDNQEKIAVYGDYDCDGIMSTVMLYSYLESCGAQVCYYIPRRDSEGYGLNRNAIKLIYDDGVRLLVTVDNGISAMEEVDFAATLGLDIVITDHHQPRDIIPNAYAVVNPHRLDDESGCEYLCGAGVCFKLICALEGDDEMPLEQYGDLVAIATVADIVPLIGENRRIVRAGLSLVQNTQNEGLAALLEVCGLSDKTLGCENIAFGLVPRINSAGRFDCVDDAIALLAGASGEEATELANQINSLNEKRRSIEDEIIKSILVKLEEDPRLLSGRIIVVYGEDWHHGVVGIVASRIVERYGKPCIALSNDGEHVRGSARSVKGFSIIDAIDACASMLVRYGGHEQAAGLTLERSQLETFIQSINDWAARHYPQMPQQTLSIDCEIPPRLLTVPNIEPLSMLEPFGSGNEMPIFALKGCVLQGIYPIGEGRHLRLRFAADNTCFYAVYFGMTAEAFPYTVGETVDLAVTLDVNEWNGEQRTSIKIKDTHIVNLDYDLIHESEQAYQQLQRSEPVAEPEKTALVPTRDDIAVVYRFLRAKGSFSAPDEVIYSKLKGNISSLCKCKIAIDVLAELRLITRKSSGQSSAVSIIEHPKKVDIMESKILQALL